MTDLPPPFHRPFEVFNGLAKIRHDLPSNSPTLFLLDEAPRITWYGGLPAACSRTAAESALVILKFMTRILYLMGSRHLTLPTPYPSEDPSHEGVPLHD